MKERQHIHYTCITMLKLRYTSSTVTQGEFLNGTTQEVGVRVMVFNSTFNNISVISWQSVLLAEETWVHGENHIPAASHSQTLSHYVVSSTPRMGWIRTHNIRVIGTDCISSYKSNYHTIMATTALTQEVHCM